mmetsp:Transcript_20450/g.42026  ORF Transcript_20450/g.42026 Transcript_20450/m.42026 type:complete len:219 (+) Transcript_20450:380-1036(+)
MGSYMSSFDKSSSIMPSIKLSVSRGDPSPPWPPPPASPDNKPSRSGISSPRSGIPPTHPAEASPIRPLKRSCRIFSSSVVFLPLPRGFGGERSCDAAGDGARGGGSGPKGTRWRLSFCSETLLFACAVPAAGVVADDVSRTAVSETPSACCGPHVRPESSSTSLSLSLSSSSSSSSSSPSSSSSSSSSTTLGFFLSAPLPCFLFVLIDREEATSGAPL